MPLSSLPLPLPDGVVSVSAGDVDGDGRDELILESRLPSPGRPDGVTLTVVPFDDAGRPGAPRTFPLGDRAGLWDAGGGLWWLDREGLVRLDQDGARVAKLPTLVTALGPTTPRRAPLVHDLDGDGVGELVVWSAGRYVALRADGSAFGSVPAAAEGELDPDFRLGGNALDATIRPPPLVVGDVDGDGKLDLLLPDGAKAKVYYTGEAIGARAATLALPFDLEPTRDRTSPKGETRRDVSGVWLQDLDGDHRVDLGVHRTVLNGSWFGATSEWVYAKGTGSGFGPPQVVPIDQAAFGLRPKDLDGDGRWEVVGAFVDVGLSNIARALVSREVQAQLSALRMNGAAYESTLVPSRALRFSLETPDELHVDLEGDVDGDGTLDLVADDASTPLAVYRGGASGPASTATWATTVDVPPGDESLFVHDLTGDGRAEIVIWGRASRTATVLRLP